MKDETRRLLEKYKSGYIREMRKTVGHEPLWCMAAGLILTNSRGEVLLQLRKDNGRWGLIGGSMEIGETYEEVIIREAYEEAGIKVRDLKLFGIYSGEDSVIEYPNGDICLISSVIFATSAYEGEILQDTEEAFRHAFFAGDSLPADINEFDRKYLEDWKKHKGNVIIA